MSVEKARAHLEKFGVAQRIREFEVSSATVALAAVAVGVEPARIAKTLSFKSPEGEAFLVVAAGDTKIDNKKFREYFGFKAKMLDFAEVEPAIGHGVGGVCPFGINDGVKVYLDDSMKRFDTVFPAAGGENTAVELSIDELTKTSLAADWIDVCKIPE